MNKTTFGIITPERLLEMASRRDALRNFGKLGAGLAMASVPIGLAGLTRRAFAQAAQPSVTDVLNFALTLEYLEAEFYNIGMATSGLIPQADRRIFGTIRDHENAHVEFLLNALGGDAVDKPNFDFTAGGAFMPFESYAQFQILALAFEDTGVRAYKGQAPNLMSNPDVLTAALTIHSVEARHAAEVRRLRGNFDEEEPDQGWITRDNPGTGMPPATEPVYGPGTPPEMFPSEANTTHGGLDVSTLSYNVAIDNDSFSESYDEPLDMGTVLTIAGMFIES